MSNHVTSFVRRAVRLLFCFSRRVHSDQRGTISIVSVFALLMFTMLLVMIVNVGRHVDDKVKMQNAADASAYSGGVVLARGMNAVAFTNHLLCDVFAVTAFLREGRDRNAEQLVPEILDAWDVAGQTLAQAEFEPFQLLGNAIVGKVPLERQAVTTYGEMTAASSELTLDVFEYTLEQKLIPTFQRTLIRSIPELAQHTADQVAKRHANGGGQAAQQGNPRFQTATNRGPQIGVLWRMNVMPVGYPNEDDPLKRTLPIVDPDPAEGDFASVPFAEVYLTTAVRQRRDLAKHYLDAWNFDRLSFFNRAAKMSNYFHLWRIATCAQLEQLLNVEYPVTNLPMVIRKTEFGVDVESRLSYLERTMRLSRRNYDHFPTLMQALRREIDLDQYFEKNFNFASVVYRGHLRESGPGLFQNPLHRQADALTFAQMSLFVPRPRMLRWFSGGNPQNQSDTDNINLGGTYGYTSNLEMPREAPAASPEPQNTTPRQEHWGLENWPTHWDLLNQNWMVQLVPATASRLPEILQNNPGGKLAGMRPPNLGGIGSREFKTINNH